MSRILLVRLGDSHSSPGACMYYFRMFELNINAMPPVYSMLHTGNFVYDDAVQRCLESFKTENGGPFALAYYDNTSEVVHFAAAEEVVEQDGGEL